MFGWFNKQKRIKDERKSRTAGEIIAAKQQRLPPTLRPGAVVRDEVKGRVTDTVYAPAPYQPAADYSSYSDSGSCSSDSGGGGDGGGCGGSD